MVVSHICIFDKIEIILLYKNRNNGNSMDEIIKSKLYIIIVLTARKILKNLSRYYRENFKLVTTKLAEHRVGIIISI